MALSEEEAAKILEISKGASVVEITAAYKKKALVAHPDKGGNPEQFRRIQQAKEKLVSIAELNSKPVSAEMITEEDVKGVIVPDASFFLLEHEKEFREWRKPNMKIMSRLTANHRNKETEMVIDYCKMGYGGSYQSIESYIRDVAGITSPYHMNERVVNIKRIIETFMEYQSKK